MLVRFRRLEMGNVCDDRLLGTGVAETQSARMQVVRNMAGDMIDVVVENADESFFIRKPTRYFTRIMKVLVEVPGGRWKQFESSSK